MKQQVLCRLLLLPVLAGCMVASVARAQYSSYAVPAISNEKRLPDRLPQDGRLSDELRAVGAQGEIVPASFMIFPERDLGAVQLTASALAGDQGSIPAANVDIRVVKCWYQGGTGWHSYFADSDRRVLIPELLLHDEDLIRVDDEAEENYVRLGDGDAARYRWVSYPDQVKGALPIFNHALEPVADSAELQPVQLSEGSGKQFWLTLRIPEEAAAGLYTGTISLAAGGEELGRMTVTLRVLPFSLPPPRTWYDLERDFLSTLYNHTNLDVMSELLGEDRAAAERKVLAEMKNLRDHNVDTLLLPRIQRRDAEEIMTRQLELMQEAGMSTDPLIGFMQVYNWELLYRYLMTGNEIPPGKWQQLVAQTEEQRALIQKVLGHTNIYGIGWDEPGRSVLEAQLPLFALLHDMGMKVYSTGKDTHFGYAGFNEDIVNYPGHEFKPESARKWHAMGARIVSYAGPHTGPENPDFIRRTHGFQLYKADYDGSANYRYYGYRRNIWNDFDSESYRICFVYPTRDGIIDTLHWEGFREAIDDIRYATKLCQVANEAVAAGSAEARYAGKKALQYLALLDQDSADLNTVRLEIIDHILRMQRILEGDAK